MHMVNVEESQEGLEGGNPRELKFKVPSEYQRKLYGLKIVTGKNLSQLVTEAVGAYLQELEVQRPLDMDSIVAMLEAQGQPI